MRVRQYAALPIAVEGSVCPVKAKSRSRATIVAICAHTCSSKHQCGAMPKEPEHDNVERYIWGMTNPRVGPDRRETPARQLARDVLDLHQGRLGTAA